VAASLFRIGRFHSPHGALACQQLGSWVGHSWSRGNAEKHDDFQRFVSFFVLSCLLVLAAPVVLRTLHGERTDQTPFFGSACAHGVCQAVLLRQSLSNNVPCCFWPRKVVHGQVLCFFVQILRVSAEIRKTHTMHKTQ
jgi:hypothetical protein